MAQIIDANTTRPVKGEKYFVDTNVWFWATYVPSRKMVLPNHPRDYQINDYPAFLERAIGDGANLCHSTLTLAEISNVIEATELDIYRKQIGNDFFDKKEFRRIKDLRAHVLTEIEMAWKTINTMSTCIDVRLDLKFADDSRRILAEGEVDPFDAFIIQTMRASKIDYIVTDDHDFCAIGDQILVTANKKSLKEA